ncbi:MAG TPA: hypothetical protein VFA07_04625 [Chthonomonadaceae bacterium]|nr:hypothetical protein [Chthonomonadaceae bacterium]
MIHRRVPPRLAASLLIATIMSAILLEAGAYYSGVRAEARITARRHLPTNYCISCHSDSHSLRLMLEKEGREGAAAHLPGGVLDPDATGAHALSSARLK